MATEELECCEDCQIHPDRLDIVNSGMPEEEELYDLAELFKVFGDSTRIRILFVLFGAEGKESRFFILWQTGMCVRSLHRAANILKKNKEEIL